MGYRAKCRGFRHSQVREDLAVQGDLGFLEPFHKPVVRKAVQPRSCADTGDPEAPEVSLAGPPVPIRVAERSLDGLFSLFQGSASAAHVTFGGIQDLLSSGPTCGRTSCSGHNWLLQYRTGCAALIRECPEGALGSSLQPIANVLRVRQQPSDLGCVLCIDKGVVSQVSLAFRGLAR